MMHSDGHECHSNGSSLRIDISPITKPTYKQQLANQLLLQVACMTACTNLAYQPKDQSERKVKPRSNLSRKGVPCCSIAIWSQKSDLPGYYRQEIGRKTVSSRTRPCWIHSTISISMIHSTTYLSNVHPHSVLSIFESRREQ